MSQTLLYGDSLLHGLPPIRGLHNESQPGRTLFEALRDDNNQIGLNMLLDEDRYDNLIICLGTNDLAYSSPMEVMSLLQQLLSKIQHRPRQIFVTEWPHESHKVNNLLELHLDDQITIIPFMVTDDDLIYDGIHLNQRGLDAMRRIIEEELNYLQ